MKLSFRIASAMFCLVGLALVGCTASETPEAEVTSVAFACPDGETIEAIFPVDGGEEVIVTLPEQEAITLPQVESGSGAKYSDGTTTFWEHAGEAMVEVNGEVVLQGCTVE